MNKGETFFVKPYIRKTEARNSAIKGIRISCLFFVLFSSFFSVGTVYSFEKPIKQPTQKIAIKKLKPGNYQLIVEDKPFIIKGVCYNPVPIGAGYDYDLSKDKNEPWKIDGRLMQKVGVNAIRLYNPGTDVEGAKKIIDYFYRQHGIRTILGHWLGFWEGSSVSYGDREFRARIKKEVIQMVKNFKDEPGLLMWVLGNENNYSFGPQNLNAWTTPELEKISDPYEKRIQQAKIYYTFVNEIAREIKSIDKVHPVALGNGGVAGLEVASRVCKDIDLLGISSYSGKSFGSIFRQIDTAWGRSFFFTEFGADSYDAKQNKPREDMQEIFIKSQWKEIEKNLANESGLGNSLGGCIFEWTDEWWKYEEFNPYNWNVHNSQPSWSNGAYYFDIGAPRNLNMNEEWWGLIKLIPAKSSGLDKRIPKRSYYLLQELWAN